MSFDALCSLYGFYLCFLCARNFSSISFALQIALTICKKVFTDFDSLRMFHCEWNEYKR